MSGFNPFTIVDLVDISVNKIYLGKLWRLTLCGNHAANKMVDLTLYCKGWVEASHRDFVTTKAGYLKAELYLRMLTKKCLPLLSIPSHRCCKMVGAAGTHLTELCLLSNTMNKFPFQI